MSRENPQYHIFVVDDDIEVAEVIQKYLRREGFHSSRAASGAEAISWLGEHRADLMLLDFRLSDMTAEDLVESLSERELLIPFIIITGLGDERVAVEMMKRGARDYLIKDASLVKLLPSVVTQLLEQLEGEKRLAATEEALRKSEQKYRTLFEQAGDAIEITDEQGRVIDCNQGLCDLLGHTREELLNRPAEEFASLEYKNFASQRMTRILEGGMPPFESGAVRKDGSRVDIEVSAAPIEIEGRNHIIYFLRDITERKQAEASRARARRQACIAQLGQLALGETDISAWFDEGLPHVAEMLDLDKCMVLELLPDGQALRLKSGVGWTEGLAGSATLDTGVSTQAGYTLLANEPVIVENQSEETRFTVPSILTDHGVISVLSVVIPGHERPYGVLSAHSTMERTFNQEDIDFLESVANLFATVIENKRLDDKLRQAQKVAILGQLASGVAHDFNNSLGVILGYIELLQGHAEDPKSLKALEIVKKAALSGERTIKRLLDYARKRTDRPKGRADLNRVIQDVIEMTRPRWKSEAEMRGIAFEMDFEKQADRPWIRGEESEIHEALMNLVNNSLDAMPAGEKIMFQTENVEEGVRVKMSDSGEGMSSDEAARAFEPFFTTKGEQGNGLGLSMVSSIVGRHEGQIRLESAPGEGTTVWMTLPAPSREAPEREDLPAAPTVPRRILLIDDDRVNTELFSAILGTAGHQVETSNDPQEGLRVFRSGSFDVVITDFSMLGISGLEVAKAAKDHDPNVPVLLITGWGGETDNQELTESGVDVLLSKPLLAKDLLNAIAQVLPDKDGKPA